MVTSVPSIGEQIARDGFALVENFASSEVVEALLSSLVTEPLEDRAGTRQLHQRNAAVSEFMNSADVNGRIEPLIPSGFVVRSILFDKTRETNWRVPRHQDLSICVKERRAVLGFTAWSIKEGVHHVQPPVEVLSRMLTLRLHLDDCGEDNGPLRVIPGSHKHGRISPDEIPNWKNKGPIVDCTVPKGGAIIMKPLLLHSSSAAKNPNHRRVLHIEFASEPLPKPLEWIS
jgi:hypothetical protein